MKFVTDRNCKANNSFFKTFEPLVNYYNWSQAQVTLQTVSINISQESSSFVCDDALLMYKLLVFIVIYQKITTLSSELNKTVRFVNNINIMPAAVRSDLQRYYRDVNMVNYTSFSNVVRALIRYSCIKNQHLVNDVGMQ